MKYKPTYKFFVLILAFNININSQGLILAEESLILGGQITRTINESESLTASAQIPARELAKHSVVRNAKLQIKKPRNKVTRMLARMFAREAEVMLSENSSINGRGNNKNNPSWGSTNTLLTRLSKVAYQDGSSVPSGANRPNPRAISNACMGRVKERHTTPAASNFFWQWGQFLDHDIDLTPTIVPAEPFNIAVPIGDPYFDPTSTGTQIIGLTRSIYKNTNGVREQINEITAYIDGSGVYGSDEKRALELRTLDGSGRLKMSVGQLMPFNENFLPNGPTQHSKDFFLAGDVRANEQVGLIAVHTLFVREHNFWARQIQRAMPTLSGEEIYQSARRIVAAEIQAITFNEFLPVLLGKHALGKYEGYNPNVNPAIANEFSTAAFRLGHSMLSSKIMRLKKNGRQIKHGYLELKNAFFNPKEVTETGIEPLLRGLALAKAENVDMLVIDDVRNFLFGEPGQGGFDLAALNIQRGRDHGLTDYNSVRTALGLEPVKGFYEITRIIDRQLKLASAYGNVDNLDLWVAGLTEDHYSDAMVGETFYHIIRDQFQKLRSGDRFWYENHLPKRLVKFVNEQTLATIIRRNTKIEDEIQDQVLMMPVEEKSADS